MCQLLLLAHRLIMRGGGILGFLGQMLDLLEHFVFSNSISARATIGARTYFYHRGLGCVIHPKAEIGTDCILFQHVTIGSKWSDGVCKGEAPTIGNRVMIGAGACILGNIHIGDNVIIGCNSVVVHDVPANSVVVGNPAKIIKHRICCDE